MKQLSWRIIGPQGMLIQEMVDFFWNVGAPETEIDLLNEIGALINPMRIGSWIDMSSKGGMDGGWVFPVDVNFTNAVVTCDESPHAKKFEEWCKTNSSEQMISVGRDMGAAPPRHSEINITMTGSFEEKLQKVIQAYNHFGFPAISEPCLTLLREWKPSSMILTVVISVNGFIRVGVIMGVPDSNIISQLVKIVDYKISPLEEFQQKAKTQPSLIEFQYLNEGFGYGVYNEGFNVMFHYALDKIKL